MQYCNGTNWINTGAVIPSAPQTGCTTPAGTAGSVIYNTTLGVVQFCNGSNWVDTACAATRSPGGSGCGGSPAGSIKYVAGSVNELQFCDSTDWVAMGWPCGSGGLTDWSLIQKIIASDATANEFFGYSVQYPATRLLLAHPAILGYLVQLMCSSTAAAHGANKPSSSRPTQM